MSDLTHWPYNSANILPTLVQEHAQEGNEKAQLLPLFDVALQEKHMLPQVVEVIPGTDTGYKTEFVNVLNQVEQSTYAQPAANQGAYQPEMMQLGFDGAHSENLVEYNNSTVGWDTQ